MRKLIFIFSILLSFASCTRVEIDAVEGGRQIEDGMLLVDFSIKNMPLHSGTKALSADPQIRSLKIVVFDNHGVYISQSDATLSNVVTSEGITTGYYAAHFPVSDKNEKRIIHFIANYSEDIEYGTELEVISKLTVNENTDCYWQRVEVANLMAVEQDGNMVLVNQNSLKNIVLIRNFCAFTVSASNTSNLDIVSAAIYNVPDRGTIAPYSSDNSSFVGGNGFVTNYQNFTSPESLITAGYKASVPLTYDLTRYSNSDVMTDSDGTSVKLFAYEREVPLHDPPFILVSGKWGKTPEARRTASTTYYKINLRDVNDDYFPLLRNFDYKIEILEVRREGDTDIQEALKSPGSGEISTDIRFGNLTEISNGEAKIMVTTTDMVLVNGDAVQVKYKFIPDISSDTPANDNVTITLGASGLTGAVFNSLSDITKDAGNDGEGWRTITLDPDDPGPSPRRQSVTIVGRYTIDAKEYTISRTINFTLRQKPEFTLECVDGSGDLLSMIEATKETPFTLKIGIPGGLPSSMFPLEIAIEARERSISPDMSKQNNNLPVVSGRSIFDDSTAPSFHFIKTLQYSEYNEAELVDGGYKYFNAYFKSNIDLCATEIIVKNKFFNDKTTFLESTAYWTLTFNQGYANGKIFYDEDDDPSALACGTGAAGISENNSRWVIENAGNNKYRLRLHNTQVYIQNVTAEKLISGDKTNSALFSFYRTGVETSFSFSNTGPITYAMKFGETNYYINRWSGENGTHGGAWGGGNASSEGNLIRIQRNTL